MADVWLDPLRDMSVVDFRTMAPGLLFWLVRQSNDKRELALRLKDEANRVEGRPPIPLYLLFPSDGPPTVFGFEGERAQFLFSIGRAAWRVEVPNGGLDLADGREPGKLYQASKSLYFGVVRGYDSMLVDLLGLVVVTDHVIPRFTHRKWALGIEPIEGSLFRS